MKMTKYQVTDETLSVMSEPVDIEMLQTLLNIGLTVEVEQFASMLILTIGRAELPAAHVVIIETDDEEDEDGL